LIASQSPYQTTGDEGAAVIADRSIDGESTSDRIGPEAIDDHARSIANQFNRDSQNSDCSAALSFTDR
jgi:hypothetical protein